MLVYGLFVMIPVLGGIIKCNLRTILHLGLKIAISVKKRMLLTLAQAVYVKNSLKQFHNA